MKANKNLDARKVLGVTLLVGKFIGLGIGYKVEEVKESLKETYDIYRNKKCGF